MRNHDPGCEGGSNADPKLLRDVAKYGWHVMTLMSFAEAQLSLAADGAIAWFSSNLILIRLDADRAPQLKPIVMR